MSHELDTAGAIDRATAPHRHTAHLATLAELSAQWLPLDCEQLLAHVADTLRDMLELDFICMSVAGLATQADVHIARATHRAPSADDARALAKTCDAARAGNRTGIVTVPDPWTSLQTPVATVAVELDALQAQLMAGKRQAGFPDDATRVLLRAALNLAAPHLRRIDTENALRKLAGASSFTHRRSPAADMRATSSSCSSTARCGR